jgi:chaperone modulatory protein CbpM
MNPPVNPASAAASVTVVVDESVHFTLSELGRACRVSTETLLVLVREGVLTPIARDESPPRFDGAALARARRALRLVHDLEIDAAATALVLDLLDEIERLRARLRRLGTDG